MLISSVHFLFIIFIVMLSLVILLFVIVLLYNFREYTASVRTAGWLKVIDEKISGVIVYAEDEVPEHKQFELLSGNASFRNMLLEKLVDSEKKFSGSAKDKIRSLFKDYHLRNESVNKLKQKKPHLIARGIHELTVMDVDGAVPEISRFLSHPSVQVYQEAQYAMVRFNGFKGLQFLDTFPSRISEWQQLRLLLSIPVLPAGCEAVIEKWLDSINTTVVVFSFKLIRKFQLLALYPKIISLFSTSSTEVRIKAVQTLTALENPETVPYLAGIYDSQPEDVRMEILNAIRVSKDQCCTDLLKRELSESVHPGIKVNAAQALSELGHHEYLSALAGSENASEELTQIIKYALQEKV